MKEVKSEFETSLEEREREATMARAMAMEQAEREFSQRQALLHVASVVLLGIMGRILREQQHAWLRGVRQQHQRRQIKLMQATIQRTALSLLQGVGTQMRTREVGHWMVRARQAWQGEKVDAANGRLFQMKDVMLKHEEEQKQASAQKHLTVTLTLALTLTLRLFSKIVVSRDT